MLVLLRHLYKFWRKWRGINIFTEYSTINSIVVNWFRNEYQNDYFINIWSHNICSRVKKKYLIHFLVKLNFLNIFNMFFFYLYNMVTRIIVIPQTCWYNGNKFDCGLSISCVLEGGKPVDLCSGGMIWSCCVSRDKVQTSASSSSSSTTSSSSSSSAVASASNSVGTIENASEFFFFWK